MEANTPVRKLKELSKKKMSAVGAGGGDYRIFF